MNNIEGCTDNNQFFFGNF